jgi:hypothetical protein
LLYATATTGTKSGAFSNSHGVSGLMLKNAGTAALTDLGLGVGQPAAGVATEGTLVTAQQSIAKDAVLSADLTLWGNSPSITNTVVVVWVQRQS